MQVLEYNKHLESERNSAVCHITFVDCFPLHNNAFNLTAVIILTFLEREMCVKSLVYKARISGSSGDSSDFHITCIFRIKRKLNGSSREAVKQEAETYHICNLIFLPSNSIVLILKSIPARKQAQCVKIQPDSQMISQVSHLSAHQRP